MIKWGPALGVAILAGVGAGLYPSVQEACRKFVKTAKTCGPIPENEEFYKKAHPLYQKLYADLEEDYRELAAL